MFDGSPKHGGIDRKDASRRPKDGQAALDNSIEVKPTSARRVGVDAVNAEIVILDQTTLNRFHGHVRTWAQLTDQQRNALIKNKLTDKRGSILKPEERV